MKYKHQQVAYRQNDNDYPTLECVFPEQLETISDDELYDRLRELESGRDKAMRMSITYRPWEEEICYIRREIQIRRGRREAHVKYMDTIAAEIAQYERLERVLPIADLDNTKFITA